MLLPITVKVLPSTPSRSSIIIDQVAKIRLFVPALAGNVESFGWVRFDWAWSGGGVFQSVFFDRANFSNRRSLYQTFVRFIF